MNIFKAIGETLNSIVSVLTAAARTTEKSVILLENEVDLLNKEQNIRISSAGAKLAIVNQQAQLEQL